MAFVVWLTGLPASGKSTIAGLVCEQLSTLGVTYERLDSDEVRKIVTPEPTYSTSERDVFYRGLAFFASRLATHGVNVVIDATANRRAYRDLARTLVPQFLEVLIDCPIDICRARDQKGTYKKAAAALATTVPGAQQAYEPPLTPELRIDTSRTNKEQAANQVMALLMLMDELPKGRQMTVNLRRELEVALEAVTKAGARVRAIVRQPLTVTNKNDGDPVTEADLVANAIIIAELSTAFPGDAIISEEIDTTVTEVDRTWFIDPIDGTRELIAGTGDFCISIGLAMHGVPTLGIIHHPLTGETFSGGVGHGASRNTTGSTSVSIKNTCERLLTSRTHRHPLMDRMKEALGCQKEIRVGSVGIKCCRIASGDADIYLEPYGQTYTCDTCAAQALIEAAGGRMTDVLGQPLQHHGRGHHRNGLLATNGRCHDQAVAVLTSLLGRPTND